MEKIMNQFDFEKLLPYFYYLILALWGGVVRYIIDLRKDSTIIRQFFQRILMRVR